MSACVCQFKQVDCEQRRECSDLWRNVKGVDYSTRNMMLWQGWGEVIKTLRRQKIQHMGVMWRPEPQKTMT